MRTSLKLTCVLAVAFGCALPATAAAAPVVVVHDAAVSAKEQKAVLNYWTPERVAGMPTGPESPGAQPVDGPDGAPVPAGTAVDRTVGRLFFVDRGEDSSCTATLVTSANRATAVTAGHCVHGFDLIGNDPRWTSKLLFVPGFRDNTRPFGSYVVRSVVAHRTWVADDQQSAFDQAFLVLAQPAGAGQPLALGLPGGLATTELGYPRAAGQSGHQGRPEFTGQRVARCWGTAAGAPEDLWGVACDMGGGSSGGPRLANFDDRTGRGVVVGVNTQSARLGGVRHLVGPRFTAAVTGPLYQRAAIM
jgi:hypothetical protein